jgi:hypothetical protein
MPRRHKLTTSYNDIEWEDFCRLAADRGMKPGACLAKLGTDAANGLLLSASQADAVAQLRDATKAANYISGLLNEAVRNNAGRLSPDIDAVARTVAAAVIRLQVTALKTAKELRR